MKILAKPFIALLLLIAMSNLVACGCISGKGEVKSQTRDLSTFTKIIIEGSANLNIQQADNQEVTVVTHENLFDYIETDINGSTLIISSKGSICYDRLDINIKMKNLEGVIIEGSGNILADGDFEADVFKAKISGSGDIKIKKLDVIELECGISGSGSIKLRGEAVDAQFDIDGSGDIIANEVETEKVEIEINGSGNCLVWAKESLKIEINGSGDVKYKGDPSELKISQNGSGETTKIK
jgi:Putative auto-transporter adhesin, head GIN domain